MPNLSRSAAAAALLGIAALLGACRGSPFDGPSQIPDNPEQDVIDGRGGNRESGAAEVGDEETDLEEMNSRDTDQDPVLNNDG